MSEPPHGDPAALPAPPVRKAADLLSISQILGQAAMLDADSASEVLRRIVEIVGNLSGALGKIVLVETGEGLSEEFLKWGETSTPLERAASEQLYSLAPEKLATQSALAVSLEAQGHPGHYLIGTPFCPPGQPPRYVALLLRLSRRELLEPLLATLQGAMGYAFYGIERLQPASARRDASSIQKNAWLHCAEADHFMESLRVLANDLSREFGCAGVYIGIKKDDRAPRVVAASGVSEFDYRSAPIQSTGFAINEAAKADLRLLTYRRDLEDVRYPAHRELTRTLDAQAVTTFAHRFAHGHAYVCIVVVWDARHPVREDKLPMIEQAAPSLCALAFMCLSAEPPAWRRLTVRAWRGISASKRRSILIGLIALCLLMLIPFPHRIGCRSQVVPETKRVVAAPFDGLLKEAFVEPGDTVESGTPLAKMDDKDLKWKKAELVAARERAFKKRDVAVSSPDSEIALSQMATFEAEGVEQEIRLIDQRLENLEIRAPIEGVVVEGDLKRAEGVPLAKGDILFEVAPLSPLSVEMEVEDALIPYVKEGQEVIIRLDAFPSERWRSKVLKILPRSASRSGRNVFLCEAPLELKQGDTQAPVRPGMQGRAIVVSSSKPLIWLISHRFFEFIQTTLFW